MRPAHRVIVWLLLPVWTFLFSLTARGESISAAVVDIRFGEIEPPVVAQQDITVRAATSNQQQEEKPLECSGLAWCDGQLLISSDRHEHLVFTCAVDLDKMVIGTPSPKILIRNEQYLLSDAESLLVRTIKGQSSLLIMGSMSNAPNGQPLPQRRHLFWADIVSPRPFRVAAGTSRSAGAIRRQVEVLFDTIKLTPYYAFNADYVGDDKNTYRWGNVEGVSFTPDGSTLLCGMRNPLYEHKAILFAVAGIPEALPSLEPDIMAVSDLFLLDLGGRGVSDLAWDAMTQGYLITGAKSNGPRLDPDAPYPPNTLDSALFWWSGHKADRPILIARIPDMTIEAVCRLGESRYIALGSDEGDVSEGRAYRQSVLTILEFGGIRRKP